MLGGEYCESTPLRFDYCILLPFGEGEVNIRKINELVQNRADNIDYFLPLLFWADWLTLNIFCWVGTLLSLIFVRGRDTKIVYFIKIATFFT